jgi:hypothetical protein
LTDLKLPDAGPLRFWEIKHQPTKKTTPVRIELRQRTNTSSKRIINSWTRLLGYEDTTADESALILAAETVLERVSRVDDFVGIHITNKESEVAA